MKNTLKTILIASSLLIGFNTKAGDTFTVTKDGKTKTYPSDEYVVVKKRKKAPKVVKAPEAPKPVEVIKVPEIVKPKRNRIAFYMGVGLLGLDISSASKAVTVQEQSVPVFGISLSHMISDKYSITGSVLSNETFLLGIGYDY